MNSSFSLFISFHMDNFSISYITFFRSSFFFFFFNAGPMLIAVFITKMVILHKYVLWVLREIFRSF